MILSGCENKITSNESDDNKDSILIVEGTIGDQEVSQKQSQVDNIDRKIFFIKCFWIAGQ